MHASMCCSPGLWALPMLVMTRIVRKARAAIMHTRAGSEQWELLRSAPCKHLRARALKVELARRAPGGWNPCFVRRIAWKIPR